MKGKFFVECRFVNAFERGYSFWPLLGVRDSAWIAHKGECSTA